MCVPLISAGRLYLSTSAHQTVAAPAPCLIGVSPVELCLSDMSAISAGAQAGVNPVSSDAIIY